MSGIRKRWLERLWPGQSPSQRGQALVIVIFAFVGLLAVIGLGIDLGMVYVERVRLGRAVDSAALAAVSELPMEAAAHQRALDYLRQNGYDYAGDEVTIFIDGQHVVVPQAGVFIPVPPPNAETRTTIWLDAAFSRNPDAPPGQDVNTANHIRVRVRRQVPMTFLQFIGFRRFPVEARAEAENITSLDVVIVYDKSGSMEFDTLCYECWVPQGVDSCTNPDGCIFPLPWSTVSSSSPADHCRTNATYTSYSSTFDVNDYNYRHKTYTSRYYIIIEAEEYSRMREEADYHSWGYTPYKTFWVIQRNDLVGAMGRDSRGAYLSHNPFTNAQNSQGGLGVACTWSDLTNGQYCRRNWSAGNPVPGGPFPAPRADYDFNAPTATTYYFWIRGQGGYNWGKSSPTNQSVFWGVDQSPRGEEANFPQGPAYDGASSASWDWRCLGSVSLSAGTHTFNLWGGGAGFDVDRILITTYDGGQCSADSDPPDSTASLPANRARTDWACNPCDPRFAGRPGGARAGTNWLPDCRVGANPDQSKDPIYTGEMPIRAALNAARDFIARMDPYFDQIGYVRYSDSAEIVGETSGKVTGELQCLRRLGPPQLESAACNPNLCNPTYQPPCANLSTPCPCDMDCGCYSGVITNTVLYALNNTQAGGGTNIADGIRKGILVLSTTGTHYGRPGAAHIMVLMTDGEANAYPTVTPSCYADSSLWPETTGDTNIDRAKDCVIYYARQARNNGIVIYTISLGEAADQEIMQAVADLTGGYHRWAPTSDKLDAIFDELFERIFLRLVE